jgi:hypothetical protein
MAETGRAVAPALRRGHIDRLRAALGGGGVGTGREGSQVRRMSIEA